MHARTVDDLRAAGFEVERLRDSEVVVVRGPGDSELLFAGPPVCESGEPPEVYAPCRRPAGELFRVASGEMLLLFHGVLWQRLARSYDPNDSEAVLAVLADPGKPERRNGDTPELTVLSAPALGAAARAHEVAAVWLGRTGARPIRPVAFLGAETAITVQRAELRDVNGGPLRGAAVLGLRDLRRPESSPRGVELEVIEGGR